MSDLAFKGYKKWQKENGGASCCNLVPSNKKVKRKNFRVMRRIIKTKTMVDGKTTVNGNLPTKVDWAVLTSADTERKSRQRKKDEKLRYYEAGNRKLSELKQHGSVTCRISCGDMIMTNNGWQHIHR